MIRDKGAAMTQLWNAERRAKALETRDVMTSPFGFAVGASGAYWITSDSSGAGAIRGGSLEPGARLKPIAEGLQRPYALSLDRSGAFVLWTDPGSSVIGRASKDGTSRAILAREAGGPRRIAADDAWVYWTSGDGTIKKVRTDGGGSPVVLAEGQGEPAGIAVDQAYVYWVNARSGQVMKVAK